MTISEQAKNRVLEKAGLYRHEVGDMELFNAFARFIQETSDKGKAWAGLLRDSDPSVSADIAESLILPDDEPDAGEAFDDAWHLLTGQKSEAKAKMAAAGFKIVKASHDG